MLELFIVSIQTALPLCLAVSILVASRAHAPMERQTVAKLTFASTAIGLLGAGVFTWLRLNTPHVDIPVFTAWAGIALFITMFAFLVMLWLFGDRDLHDINQGMRHRGLTVTAILAICTSALYYAVPYFYSTDSIVHTGGSVFETASLLRLAGFSLGTILAVVACWGYVQCAKKVPWWVRTLVTSVVFMAMILPRMILLYQQFATRRIVPSFPGLFDIVLWIQRNEAMTQLILVFLIAFPGFIALWTQVKKPPHNPAERRLQKADTISRRQFFGLSSVLAIAFAWSLTDGKRRSEYVPELTDLEATTLEGDFVCVDRLLVSDGHLHRFGYKTANGVEVRFLVVRKNEVAFGVGLDACEICGDSGYYEDKGKIICSKCDVMMNVQTIGFPGGCNPIPIKYEVEDTRLKFFAEELESHEKVFS